MSQPGHPESSRSAGSPPVAAAPSAEGSFAGDSPDGQPPRLQRAPHLWRALRYLGPYRRKVAMSISAAFIAGLFFTSTLGAALPVLQTLLSGETPRAWADRRVAERRLGVELSEDPGAVRVVAVKPGSPAERMGYREGQVLAAGDEAPLFLRQTAEAAPEVLPPAPGRLMALRRAAYVLPADPVAAIAVLMGGIVMLTLCVNLVRFVHEYLSAQAALAAINDIRRDLYSHALRLPLGYFGRVGGGDVTSRIVNDAMQLQEGFRTLLGRAVQEPIMAFFALVVALIIDWRLTLFVAAFAPVMAITLQKFGKRMRRAGRATLQESAEMLGQIEATLAGIRVVKAYNAESFERRRLSAILRRLLASQFRLSRIDAASTPVMETLTILAIGVIVLVAAVLVVRQQTLSPAAFIVVFGCLITIGESLRRVSKLNVVLQRSNAAAERIFEGIDLPAEGRGPGGAAGAAGGATSMPGVRPGAGQAGAAGQAGVAGVAGVVGVVGGNGRLAVVERSRRNLPTFSREIAFEDVTFSYTPGQPPAVVGVSLTVARGESVAIVGRNGSGKTTLLSLLPRFFDPQRGRILIDGTDIRDVSLRSLRRQMGVVTQDAIVFPGTIAQNIAYGDASATRERIVAAARQAHAHEFIEQKEHGYDTSLAGLGGQLSGGQRQRLAIARAILRDAPILILDEATSQVDAESEGLIQEAIEHLMEGRTTFVIAHRISTILGCDRIVVMDAGRIVAGGRHDELLRDSEVYRQLYDRQLPAGR